MSKDSIDWHLVELKSSTPINLLKNAWDYHLPMVENDEEPLQNQNLPEILRILQDHLESFLQKMPMVWPLPVSFGVPYIRNLRGLSHIPSRKHFIGGTFLDLYLSQTDPLNHFYHSCSDPILYDQGDTCLYNFHYFPTTGILFYEKLFLTQVDSKFYLENEARWSVIYPSPRIRGIQKRSINRSK